MATPVAATPPESPSSEAPPPVAGPSRIELRYVQCVPCFRYRARCQAARPCLRCVDRGQQSKCVDVGPPCQLCSNAGQRCDRRRPCKRCVERATTGADGEDVATVKAVASAACVDGPEEEKRTEMVEVGPDGLPIVAVPPPASSPPPPLSAKSSRRLTEGEKLQAEMEASDGKRRRAAKGGGGAGEEALSVEAQQRESRREALIAAANGQPTTVTAASSPLPPPPRPSSSLPRLPPPSPLVPLRVHWPEAVEDIGAAADTSDEEAEAEVEPLPEVSEDAEEGADDSTSASSPSWPPHFRPDFAHLIPRPPLLPLSSSPVAFLNLWAHFMHVQRRPITGHHVVLQLRSITAWDVYRVVTEHGGYHRVLSRRLFHSVLSALCHSSSPASPSVLATVLPGGPPVHVAILRPRTFLIDYYERFLYAFELAYQWEAGKAPAVVPLPGRSVASVVEGKRRRKKGAAGVRGDLLKRLWAPVYHPLLFPPRDKDDSPAVAVRDEDALGYVGMSRLKRSLSSGVVAEVNAAFNRLLRLSALQGGWGGGGEEEEDWDDDEDASDACLLFKADVIADLLPHLLHPPLHQPHLQSLSPHPLLTPFLLHAHLHTRASSLPDYHTAVLVALHNLATHPHNHRRLAHHTTALNLLATLVAQPHTATLHADAMEAFTLSLSALIHLMPAVNLLHITRRAELLTALIEALQRGQGLQLGQHSEPRGLDEEEDGEVESAELQCWVLSGFIGLLTNPYHSSNIPYLLSALPASFFSLLLCLASPLSLRLSVQQLAAQTLTFFALSHRSFAARMMQVRALPTLLSFLCRTAPEGVGQEALEAEAAMRRANAATVQAICSYCGVGGGEEARKEGLQWERVWVHEAHLFTACCLDTDVAALLVPALQRAHSTRQQAKGQPT